MEADNSNSGFRVSHNFCGWLSRTHSGAHQGGHATARLLRRALRLRRVLETAFEKVLRRILRWYFGVGFRGRVVRRVLRRGSKKGLSRRNLEGRTFPFRECDPLRVRLTQRLIGHDPRPQASSANYPVLHTLRCCDSSRSALTCNAWQATSVCNRSFDETSDSDSAPPP